MVRTWWVSTYESVENAPCYRGSCAGMFVGKGLHRNEMSDPFSPSIIQCFSNVTLG